MYPGVRTQGPKFFKKLLSISSNEELEDKNAIYNCIKDI